MWRRRMRASSSSLRPVTDSPAIVIEQRSQSSPDAKVQTHRLVASINVIHVIAFDISDHFQRQFVMVAKKEAPLAGRGDLWRLLHDFCDRLSVF